MKRIISFLSACALLATACDNNIAPQKENVIDNGQELMPVSLQIKGISTKATSELSTEEKIDDLQVFVYTMKSDGTKEYDSYYSFGADNSSRTIFIDKARKDITYWIAAYANHPKIEIAESLADWSLLSNESSSRFQMAGYSQEKATDIMSAGKVEIDLIRQCSKVSVKEIAVDWTNTANRYKTFTLKSMYLMDVPGVVKNYFDLDPDVVSDHSLWQNRNGYASGSQDALLYDSISDADVTEEASYTIDHFFYGYLDPSTIYNSTSSWAPGGTRLVIAAEFDGEPCYYAVALNGVNGGTVYDDLRNMHIEFNKITITRPGASAPYEALPDESAIAVSVSVQPWQPGFSGNYTIQ